MDAHTTLERTRQKCTCGGLLDVKYAYERIPDWIDESKRGPWRYWRLFPIANPESAWDLSEGATPFFKADKLGEHLGLKNLWIKDESTNPTNTFKVREAGLTLASLERSGFGSSFSPRRGIQLRDLPTV